MDELRVELAASAWFELLRVRVMPATDLDQEYAFGPGSIVLEAPLFSAVKKFNPNIPIEALEVALRALTRPPHAT